MRKEHKSSKSGKSKTEFLRILFLPTHEWDPLAGWCICLPSLIMYYFRIIGCDCAHLSKSNKSLGVWWDESCNHLSLSLSLTFLLSLFVLHISFSVIKWRRMWHFITTAGNNLSGFASQFANRIRGTAKQLRNTERKSANRKKSNVKQYNQGTVHRRIAIDRDSQQLCIATIIRLHAAPAQATATPSRLM